MEDGVSFFKGGGSGDTQVASSEFKRWLLGLCLGYFSMAVIKHHD